MAARVLMNIVGRGNVEDDKTKQLEDAAEAFKKACEDAGLAVRWDLSVVVNRPAPDAPGVEAAAEPAKP